MLGATGWTGVYGMTLLFIFVWLFKRQKDRNMGRVAKLIIEVVSITFVDSI